MVPTTTTMEWLDLLMVATCSIGFISLSKTLIHFFTWVWLMFLRPAKNLKQYGSWAIVTGSTDGIGKAFSFELASKGLNILLVGRNSQKLESTAKEIIDRHNNIEVRYVVLDYLQKSEEIVEKMEEAMKGLDVGVLVNNAGMASPYFRYFHEDDEEYMDAIVKVNLEGATWITKAVIPKMVRKKKGIIVNIGSASSMIPSYPLASLYAATKGYLAMFSRCIGLEYKSFGIEVQCQVPLFVSTKMTKMKPSLFIPSAEEYSKAGIRWFGYRESVCVPYPLHSLQFLFLRFIPHSLLNSYLMRHFLYWRQRGLNKYSKLKQQPSSTTHTH